ncbi:hypothetical protein BJY01DRAFT_252792 [Aspergillus pseudoustus]|uniref:Uncharacterized protein n=1 Tax=Aspergillus pseudoustus TaxID=1810923 RepID=A0ABR4J5U9_9EURO
MLVELERAVENRSHGLNKVIGHVSPPGSISISSPTTHTLYQPFYSPKMIFSTFLSIPPPPPPLFYGLTLLTTTTYLATLISKTWSGRATGWLSPVITTRRRRNLALAFYIALVLLEFLQSEWVMAGDWGIISGIKGFSKWVAAQKDRGGFGSWVKWMGPLARLTGHLFVVCNSGSVVFFWLTLAVKELVHFDVEKNVQERARRRAVGEREGEKVSLQ